MSQPAGDEAQVEAALSSLQTEYEQAQEDFDADPESAEKHEALADAEAALTKARATSREGRTGVAPGGDVVVGTQPEDGGNQ